MQKIIRGVILLLAAVFLSFASYWILGTILAVFTNWLGVQSTLGKALATTEVYLSPLMGGLPLILLLVII